MAEIKFSKKADAIANIYRSALYLAQGNVEQGLFFLRKTPLSQFNHLTKDLLSSEKSQKYWAEKILDQYMVLRFTIS